MWRIRRNGYVMYAGRDPRGDRMVGWMKAKAAKQHIADLEGMGWDMAGATVEEYQEIDGATPVRVEGE